MNFDPESDIGRRYLDYIENRARIWAERYIDGREPNYRGDAVMQQYHLCNIWRELDRYSRWEIARMRGLPIEEQIDIVVLGRFAMEPGTVSILLNGGGRRELAEHRNCMRAAGRRWYTAALQIRAQAGHDYIEEFILHRASYKRSRTKIIDLIRATVDPQIIIHALPPLLYGVGPFRAYEVATSLTYSEYLTWDENALFYVGNGAVDGLEMLTGCRSIKRTDFEKLRDAVRGALSARTEFRWLAPGRQGSPRVKRRHKFTLRTLEDSLCEFRKYTAFGGGPSTAKCRKYRPENVTLCSTP